MESQKFSVNRRNFLRVGVAVGAALLGGSFLLHRWGGKGKTFSPRYPALLEHPFQSFSVYDATVLHEMTGLIIPRDQHPGAKEAMIVVELDQMAHTDKHMRQLCQTGVEWLDAKAGDLFNKKSFLDLATAAQIQVLQIAESGNLSFSEKVFEHLQFGESRIGSKFFHLVKDKTLMLFYSHPLGWLTVGYHGPPQHSGNIDYNICG